VVIWNAEWKKRNNRKQNSRTSEQQNVRNQKPETVPMVRTAKHLKLRNFAKQEGEKLRIWEL